MLVKVQYKHTYTVTNKLHASGSLFCFVSSLSDADDFMVSAIKMLRQLRYYEATWLNDFVRLYVCESVDFSKPYSQQEWYTRYDGSHSSLGLSVYAGMLNGSTANDRLVHPGIAFNLKWCRDISEPVSFYRHRLWTRYSDLAVSVPYFTLGNNSSAYLNVLNNQMNLEGFATYRKTTLVPPCHVIPLYKQGVLSLVPISKVAYAIDNNHTHTYDKRGVLSF